MRYNASKLTCLPGVWPEDENNIPLRIRQSSIADDSLTLAVVQKVVHNKNNEHKNLSLLYFQNCLVEYTQNAETRRRRLAHISGQQSDLRNLRAAFQNGPVAVLHGKFQKIRLALPEVKRSGRRAGRHLERRWVRHHNLQSRGAALYLSKCCCLEK